MLTAQEIQARFKAAAFQETNRPNLEVTFNTLAGKTVRVFTPGELYGTDLFPCYSYLLDAEEEGVCGANYDHPKLGRFSARLVRPKNN